MTLYDLSRNDLLLVLRDYTNGLDQLNTAHEARVHAWNRVNHPAAKSIGFLWVTLIKAIMIINIPTALVAGFAVGYAVPALSLSEFEYESATLSIVVGVVLAVAFELFYILIIKRLIRRIDNKVYEVDHTQYGKQEDFDLLEYCTEKEKIHQEYVNKIYNEYSIPETMRTYAPAKWIYDYLCTYSVGLNRAINAYSRHLEEEAEREAAQRVAERQYEQERLAEKNARNAEMSRQLLEEQNRLLQQMNDRQYINSFK